MKIDIEAPDHETSIEAGEMATIFFKGEALKPFSLGRQLAFQRLVRTSGLFEKAMLIVYLCTLERDQIERSRTDEGAKLFVDMEKWAEERGVAIAGEGMKSIMDVANAVWKTMEESAFEVKPKETKRAEGSSDPNDSGRAA